VFRRFARVLGAGGLVGTSGVLSRIMDAQEATPNEG
jgi:hypothetical protein